MKKLFSTTLALLLAASVTAQFSLESISFGARAGLNITSVYGTIDDAQHKAGFQLGILAQKPILDGRLTIQSGLLFSQSGYRMNTSWETTETLPMPPFGAMEIVTVADERLRMNISYLQIPINALFHFDISDNARFVLQAGPYFAFGLGGSLTGGGTRTITTTVPIIGPTVVDESYDIDGDIRFGVGPNDTRRFDFGLGIGAGVEFGNFQVGIGYNLGIRNLSNARDTSMRNTGFALTVTYLFDLF